jgi:hypothetical protein
MIDHFDKLTEDKARVFRHGRMGLEFERQATPPTSRSSSEAMRKQHAVRTARFSYYYHPCDDTRRGMDDRP